jgi:hypothetical protein
MIPVLSDTLDGDEQAHDRGDACGASCHLDQAFSDGPISGFVTPPGPDRAQAVAAGLPRKGQRPFPQEGIGVATRR